MVDRVNDPVPADVAAELRRLSSSLDRVVPAKMPQNLLIGTWNVRAFDAMTPKWRSVPPDSPIRDLSNVLCITEIIRRFDVVAIQEVRRSASAFLAMTQLLGEGWGFLVTDVVGGDVGNNERLAFVFDRQRIRPSGLACELVVFARENGVSEEVMTEQFARTPYAASFSRGGHPFTLVTLHVLWGASSQARLPELKEIAGWLADWSLSGDQWGRNLIALGDFNIDRRGDALYEAFTSKGLRTPPALNFVPRTVFDDPDPKAEPNHTHFYDQIAWFTGEGAAPAMSMSCRNAGMFNFDDGVIPATSTTQLSWRISDHFPLWVEFDVNPPSGEMPTRHARAAPRGREHHDL
jgi:endonuclease/exonuclease/phosphatase family metal-dependent hydrolase